MAWAMLRFDEVADGRSIDQWHPGYARMGVIYLYPDDIVEYHAHVRANGLEIPISRRRFTGVTEFGSTIQMVTVCGSDRKRERREKIINAETAKDAEWF